MPVTPLPRFAASDEGGFVLGEQFARPLPGIPLAFHDCQPSVLIDLTTDSTGAAEAAPPLARALMSSRCRDGQLCGVRDYAEFSICWRYCDCRYF